MNRVEQRTTDAMASVRHRHADARDRAPFDLPPTEPDRDREREGVSHELLTTLGHA
jgi:hypothetical protein